MIDQYLPGTECELDCICDGEKVLIPGIFEHIEKAGVHSGDSMAVYPPQHLSPSVQETLIRYAEKICLKGKIKGIANIQFLIYEGTVYVLEVNPRASRTVPILSKVTGIPMIDLAIAVQLGKPLAEKGLPAPPELVAVKAPVFSYTKLKDVDPVLGPEMKSTGEVLGLALTFGEALEKTLLSVHDPVFEPPLEEQFVFCSVTDREKAAALPVLKTLADRGYRIAATEHTARFLAKNGVAAETVGLEDAPFSNSNP